MSATCRYCGMEIQGFHACPGSVTAETERGQLKADLSEVRKALYLEFSHSRHCEEEVARVTAERDALKADVKDSDEENYLLTVANLEYAARLAKAEAIVERLPKTADGVVLFPGTEVWAQFTPTDGPYHGVVSSPLSEPRSGRCAITFDEEVSLCIEDTREEVDDVRSRWTEPMTAHLYSTRAAAEAAKGNL